MTDLKMRAAAIAARVFAQRNGDIINRVVAPDLHPSEATTTPRPHDDMGATTKAPMSASDHAHDDIISNGVRMSASRDASAASDAGCGHHYITEEEVSPIQYNDVRMGGHLSERGSLEPTSLSNDVRICDASDANVATARHARSDDLIRRPDDLSSEVAEMTRWMPSPEQMSAALARLAPDVLLDVLYEVPYQTRHWIAQVMGDMGMGQVVRERDAEMREATRVMHPRLDDGLHHADEITYMRLELFDNGESPKEKGKAKKTRFKVYAKYSVLPVERINPHRLTEIMCGFSTPRDFARRMTDHLSKDDDEARNFMVELREAVMAYNNKLEEGMLHSRLGNLYVADPPRGTKRWRMQVARLDFDLGYDHPTITIFNRSPEPMCRVVLAPNPKLLDKDYRPKPGKLPPPKWLGYHDTVGYGEFRKTVRNAPRRT